MAERRSSCHPATLLPGQPLPPHLHDFECLAELERLPFGELFGAVPHARLQLCAVADLRDMGAQSVDLAIEGPGNVDDFVRVLRPKNQISAVLCGSRPSWRCSGK